MGKKKKGNSFLYMNNGVILLKPPKLQPDGAVNKRRRPYNISKAQKKKDEKIAYRKKV